MTEPAATYFEDEHRYLFEEQGIELVVERFRTSRDGDLVADVQPRSALGNGFLPSEKLNLSSARSIKTYANTLAERPLQGELDWFALLGKVAALSTERLRSGEPHVWLHDVELTDAPRWLVEPFVVDRAISMLYGSGGSAKSVFGLTLAVAVASGQDIGGLSATDSGPVLVLDWEDDAETWAERQRALCVGAGIEGELDIAHLRMSASLHDSAREMRKRVASINARMVIVDSVGLASGGDPNDAGQIIRTLLAARSLKVPVLCIHHIAKDTKNPVRSGPYGSVYSTNNARISWYVVADQPEGSNVASLALTNAKTNRTSKVERQGYRLEFIGGDILESIEVTKTSISELPEDIAPTTQRWRLIAWLRDGEERTYRNIAEYLGTSEAKVRNLVRDRPADFEKLDTKPVTVALRTGIRTPDVKGTSANTVPPPPPYRGGVRYAGTEADTEKKEEEEQPW
jgi:hypothetical protein